MHESLADATMDQMMNVLRRAEQIEDGRKKVLLARRG